MDMKRSNNKSVKSTDNMDKLGMETPKQGDNMEMKTSEITYMEKEIREIPKVLERIIEHYSNSDELLEKAASFLCDTEFVHIAACGTSYHAGLIFGHLLEKQCKIRNKVYVASEFGFESRIEPNDIGIVLTQSGETTDTKLALEHMKQHGIRTVSICNVENSTIASTTNVNLCVLAGEEISIASTKAFVAQVAVCVLLITNIQQKPIQKNMFSGCEKILKRGESFMQIAKRFHDAKNIVFLGTGIEYFLAKECALKVQETCQMPVFAYPTKEFNHGPKAMVDDSVAVINYGETFGIEPSLYSYVWAIIPAQFFALALCVNKGLNPDKPRNLTKTVI